MSKNAFNQCIFQECELGKFQKCSHTWWNIAVWEKIQQAFWRERDKSLDGFQRNMKGYILEANLEGQG